MAGDSITILCIATYRKGDDFLVECRHQGPGSGVRDPGCGIRGTGFGSRVAGRGSRVAGRDQ